jgi:Transglutaminase-like superfamily
MENNLSIDTLLSLLDDHDEEVYIAVREKLLESGPSILPVLEYAISSPVSLLQHDRLELIIVDLKLSKLVEKTAIWANSEEKTLLEGWILTSTIQYPTIIGEKIELIIQKISRDIWIELNEAYTSLEKISVINHLFFDVYHFELNTTDLYAPENCLINNLLVSRKGNLISLSILYCIIAQRLKLPIHLIGIGQYLILGYYGPQVAKEVHGEQAAPYLFYINMEHKGAIIGTKELEYIVQEHKESIDFAIPLNEGAVIKRLLRILRESYTLSGDEEKAMIAHRLLEKLRKY